MKNGVTLLVIGKNKNWKQNARNMKGFAQIPFARFIEILLYKAPLYGIKIEVQEESYTSKGSALDFDPLPFEYLGKGNCPKFSGKRISRGLYKSKDGTIYNADVNGAINILRKYLAKLGLEHLVSQKWVKGLCSSPFVTTQLRLN